MTSKQPVTDPNKLHQEILRLRDRVNSSAGADTREQLVREIIAGVKANGLSELISLTKKIEKLDFQLSDFFKPCAGHFEAQSPAVREALILAKTRIEAFQKASMPNALEQVFFETAGQITLRWTALERVGIYVPGGNAALFSSLLMTAIPALVAGVREIYICSPPPVSSSILAVAELLGLEGVFQIGGAQAIAALAYGISELDLPAVDKICGPGNAYVALAKRQLAGIVGIDAFYGPSEVAVIAGQGANPQSLCLDLIAQLEHGSGLEAAVLLTDSSEIAHAVCAQLPVLAQTFPNHQRILETWDSFGLVGLVASLEEACELVDLFAPEHLEIKAAQAEQLAKSIQNAGAIFIGGSNEALGDYLAGPSHCLPTCGAARYSSGLSVYDFLRRHSVVNLSADRRLIEATAILAELEGLPAHAASARAALDIE